MIYLGFNFLSNQVADIFLTRHPGKEKLFLFSVGLDSSITLRSQITSYINI